MAPSLTHIALHVEDLDACITFYKKYCHLQVIQAREARQQQVVWMAEATREHELVLVFLAGGPYHEQASRDFSHLGFAVESRDRVDHIAQQADQEGILAWRPEQHPFPVGYYCGVRDPNGILVEFSYGQPLGPGSEDIAF